MTQYLKKISSVTLLDNLGTNYIYYYAFVKKIFLK